MNDERKKEKRGSERREEREGNKRMAKGRVREEWLRVGNGEGEREGSGVGTVTFEAATP